MSHWWLQWAERIARVLAELWIRSRSEGAGVSGPETPSRGAADVTPAPDPPTASDAHPAH